MASQFDGKELPFRPCLNDDNVLNHDSQITTIVKEVLTAVSYVHPKGLLDNSIKLHNMLLN